MTLYEYYMYLLPEGRFELKELARERKGSCLVSACPCTVLVLSSLVVVSDIIAEYNCNIKFITDIWDVFNDKPNWTAKNWGDLKGLNGVILAIAEKFGLLDKTNKKAEVELTKYLRNLESIQEGLGTVESQTLSQTSKLEHFQAIRDELNRTLSRATKEGVIMGLPSFVGGPAKLFPFAENVL